MNMQFEVSRIFDTDLRGPLYALVMITCTATLQIFVVMMSLVEFYESHETHAVAYLSNTPEQKKRSCIHLDP